MSKLLSSLAAVAFCSAETVICFYAYHQPSLLVIVAQLLLFLPLLAAYSKMRHDVETENGQFVDFEGENHAETAQSYPSRAAA